MAPDARMLTNMPVLLGGKRTRDAEVEQMPVFEKSKLTTEDIGPNVPAKWKSRVQEGNGFTLILSVSSYHFMSCKRAKLERMFWVKPLASGKLRIALDSGGQE